MWTPGVWALRSWPAAGGTSSPSCCFTQLGATHSELLALSRDGVVWHWPEGAPAAVPLPRAQELCPAADPVASLSVCASRASVLTRGGLVASWVHAEEGPLRALDHAAKVFQDGLGARLRLSAVYASDYGTALGPALQKQKPWSGRDRFWF